MMTNRRDDGAEEGLAGEIGLVEQPPVRDPFVNRKRILTIRSTSRRIWKIDFYIFLQAFFSDRFFQIQLFWTGVSDNKDNPIVGHVIQGDLNSWGRNKTFLKEQNIWWIPSWDSPQLPLRACSLYSNLPPPPNMIESRLVVNSSSSLVFLTKATSGSLKVVRTHVGIFVAVFTRSLIIFFTIGRASAIDLKIVYFLKDNEGDFQV